MPEVRPFFPSQVWPGTTPDPQRGGGLDQEYRPSGTDWKQIVQEVISVQTFALGLSAGGNNITWLGTWNALSDYVANDLVEHQGTVYIALAPNMNDEPPSANWDIFADSGADGTSFTWRGAWSAATNYLVNDVVERNGSAYIATANNTNSEPPSANWALLASKGADGANGANGQDGDDGVSFIWRGTWSSVTPYAVNDVVERNGSTYIAIAPNTNSAPPSANWNLMAQAGANGADGLAGDDGQHGGAVTIEYVFSTTTTDADPGNGNLRLNQSTQNTATVIRADLLDRNGGDWTAVLDSLDDSTSTIKGHIRLVKRDDATKWLLFLVTSVASPAGYRNVTVSFVASSEANPFANLDQIVLTFTRTGDKGDTGAVGGSLSFTSVKIGDYTAQNGEMVRCDVSGGAFTVAVPATPSTDWRFGVILTTEASGQANVVTVSAGSGPHDNKLYCQGDYIIYQYDGTAWQTLTCYLKPHQACVKRIVTQTIANSTLTKIDVSSEEFDIGGIADGAVNRRIVIRRPGIYMVSVFVRYEALTNHTSADAQCWVNGARIFGERDWCGVASGSNDVLCFATRPLNLATNAVVELYTVHTSGGDEDTSVSDPAFISAQEIR